MNRLEKMMHKERYMRGGAIQLNLLKYDIIWIVSRWGYIGKESCCKYFEFVAELFKEDKDVKASASKKKSGSKKQKEETVAKVEPEVSAEPTLPSHQEESVVAKTDADKVAEDERKELL